jgi:hypothetical protein
LKDPSSIVSPEVQLERADIEGQYFVSMLALKRPLVAPSKYILGGKIMKVFQPSTSVALGLSREKLVAPGTPYSPGILAGDTLYVDDRAGRQIIRGCASRFRLSRANDTMPPRKRYCRPRKTHFS